MKYVGQLLVLRGSTVRASEIGVISPYRKQVQKIDRQLQARFGPGIRVGSVEQFQGRVRIYSHKRLTLERVTFEWNIEDCTQCRGMKGGSIPCKTPPRREWGAITAFVIAPYGSFVFVVKVLLLSLCDCHHYSW